MRIHVSPNNGVPLYLQIINQVKYLVASGRLAPNDEVPPIRTLAERLLINPNTVARAYRDLEQAGIFVSRRGAGTYVASGGSPLAEKERLRILTERVDAILAEAHSLDISTDDLVNLIRARDEAMRSTNRETKPEEAEDHE